MFLMTSGSAPAEIVELNSISKIQNLNDTPFKSFTFNYAEGY